MSYTTTRVVAVDVDEEWEAYATPWPLDEMPSVRIVMRRTPAGLTATFDLSPAEAVKFGRSIVRAAGQAKRQARSK